MTATAEQDPAGLPALASGGEAKGLKRAALGLMSSTVIAISSTAPAYSLAAALGLIAATTGIGFHSPAVMLWAFVPMLFVAQGYKRLNQACPDCGTTFTWGAKTFGTYLGWMGGWGIFAADVIVMSNLASIAGQYMFQLFGADGLAADKYWQTAAGVAWIIVMCAICYIGIEISARIQYALLIIEVVLLLIMSIVGLAKVYAGTAPAADAADIKAQTFGAGPHHVALGWFNPFGLGVGALSAGLLTAVFVYWGWDTAVSVNEETRDRGRTPGRAAVLATIILLVTYLLVTTSAQAFAGLGANGIGLTNSDNSGDVLSVLGNAIFGAHGHNFGWFLAKLLVFMVLTSSMASTLTTILPTARTTLSMSVYKAIPDRFSRIHSKYLTPTWSTVGMGVISIALYVALEFGAYGVLVDLISALGFPIAFYYAVTGFECVWWYRRHLLEGWRTFFGAGVIPFLGAGILTALFIKDITYYWSGGNGGGAGWLGIGSIVWAGVGSLLVGVVLMFVWRAASPPYFKGQVLQKGDAMLPEAGS